MNLPRKTSPFQLRMLFPAAFVLFVFAGCATVGPEYVPPEIKAPAAWHTELKDGLAAEAIDPQTLAQWWTTFDDPLLSDLIKRSVTGNLDLKQAGARVREARARRGISQADQFPTLDASGSVTKKRSSESTGSGRKTRLYMTGFDAGWEIDIFGGLRRSVEAADADLEASQADLRDVLVSLTAEVALNYVEARTFQTRISVAEGNIKAQQETFDLIESRYRAGLSDQLAVQQARYNLESTRSQIPTLRTGLEAAKNRLAVLMGQAPGSIHALLAGHHPVPVTPPAEARVIHA